MRETIAVISLMALFFILVVASVSTKSPICDEAAHHIGSAYSYVKTADFRMNPSAPPLLRLLMGIPLLFLDLKLPLDHPSWQTINSTDFHYQFLFVYNNNAERIVFLSRLPMALVSLLLGLLIYIWSKRLYGQKAGLFAVFIYLFSPTILANAGLAMLDMGGAFFIFLFVYQLRRYILNKNLSNLLLAGICFGLAQSTKISAIILYPLSFLFLLIDAFKKGEDNQRRRLMRVAKDTFSIWAVGILVLWATYFFEFKPLLANAPDVEEKIGYIKKFVELMPVADKDRLSDALIYFAKNVPIPLSTYIVTLLGVMNIIVSNYPLYFMGHMVYGGLRLYYIVDYLIKTPLAEILLLTLSVIYFKRRRAAGFMDNIFLILPILIFFISASFSKLQGGLRYILPIYPFLYTWASGIVSADFGRYKKAVGLAIFGLSIWYAASSLLAYPDYLAYFNEIVGGPKGEGYKITADADWGQDFKALKRYMDKEGIEEVRLHCFGSVEPAYYGIRYHRLDSEELKAPKPNVYYAVSLRYLPDIDWRDRYNPIGRAGNTIFIYYTKEGISDG